MTATDLMKRLLYMVVIMALAACDHATERSATVTSDTTSRETKAEPEPTPAVPQEIRTIEDVRNAYAAIQSQYTSGDLDSTSVTYDCHGEKSGTISYFTDNGRLRLMRHSYSEYSHYSAVDSYYMQDSTLFFAFFDRLTWTFDPQAKEQGDTKDDITESRYYFIDGTLEKCLEKTYTIRSAVEDNPTPAEVPNRETECHTGAIILEYYDLLLSYRGSNETITCLEGDNAESY